MAVFAPQLLLWNQEKLGTNYDRIETDKQLKQLGSSITAVEIYKIQRNLDCLLSREDIEASQIGMIGLSYGGFYTMFTAAADDRIKAAYSSCAVNDRFVLDKPDWVWFNAGNTFMDSEVCSLICPRSLYLEIGLADDLVPLGNGLAEMAKVSSLYEKLNINGRLSAKAFEGGHELDKDEAGIDWFCSRILDGKPQIERGNSFA